MTSENNDVGYGKPPKETQFKPGQSGNPNGRPKGSKNLATDLKEELAQKIVITEGGQQQEITKQRAMLKALLSKALKGNFHAANTLLNLKARIEQTESNSSPDDTISEEDADILENFATRIRNSNPSDGEDHD